MADGRNNRNGCEHARLEYDITFARYNKPNKGAKDPERTWLVAEVRFRCDRCLHPVTVKGVSNGVVGDVPVRHPDGLVLLPLELHSKETVKDNRIIIPGGA